MAARNGAAIDLSETTHATANTAARPAAPADPVALRHPATTATAQRVAKTPKCSGASVTNDGRTGSTATEIARPGHRSASHGAAQITRPTEPPKPNIRALPNRPNSGTSPDAICSTN